MGWQDRDYARYDDPSPGGRHWASARFGRSGSRRHSITTILIIINVAVFLLPLLFSGLVRGLNHSAIQNAFEMRSDLVWKGQVWRLFTATYLHANGTHLLMNMVGLYFLGPALEQIWGRRRFFNFYTLAGVIGNFVLLIVSTRAVGWISPSAAAVGASGSILGLLGAAAVMFPQAEVLFYFFIPISIRTAAIIYVVMYLSNIGSRGPNFGGDIIHLAGMAFGVWWAWKGEGWWNRLTKSPPRWPTRPATRPVSPAKWRVIQPDPPSAPAQETVDRILKKVYDQGIQSLSPDERQTLLQATEKRRGGASY
jgi:membrane associated rhomboid family serine protease